MAYARYLGVSARVAGCALLHTHAFSVPSTNKIRLVTSVRTHDNRPIIIIIILIILALSAINLPP